MRKLLIMTALMTTALGAGCTSDSPKNNVLLENWDTPFGVPPFERIEITDYKPAVERLIAESRQTIAAISSASEPATFENTIVALEFAQQPLERVLEIFFNLNSAETSEAMQALAMELSPLLTEFSNDIMLNEALFQRVKAVHDAPSGDYTTEQKTLLEKTYKAFVRSGANLSEEQKAKYRTVTGELSRLSLQFEQNLLAATNAFQMTLNQEDEVSGLPESVKEAAAAEAREAGKEGWLFTLHAPSIAPFLTYADRRDLREKMYRAYNSRAFGGEYDNQPVLAQIVNLRLELANLLGYPTYADYVLEERMAENREKVNGLLTELLDKSKFYAEKEVETIREFAASEGFSGQMMPWDWNYYTEKYKARTYDLTDEMTRPYFRLEKVEQAMFMLADTLYGITFKENKEIPVYHPDVKAYEVYDSPERGGGLMAILYVDYFPRAGKQGGAWMTSYRSAYVDPRTGEQVIPIISLVCNFTKPTETRPSLLSFSEVTTIFHEFGHGLHGIIGRGSYPSLTGTSVYRDFVELPSQILENWVSEKTFLDLWAAHYETGEKMPVELIQKIEQTKRYLAAYGNVRQLQFGISDMAWHSISAPMTEDVCTFERRATARTQLLPVVDGTCFAPSFAHIFAGGYAAGYYSYKWAEVLEADAFAKFLQNGLFDKATATSFRDNILTPGGSEHPMTLFVRFAGSEPTVEPLIEKMGLK